MNLSRRRFLNALGVGTAALPLISLPRMTQAQGRSGQVLVLIELAGGNDGLNTVAPLTDPDYKGLRPTIGLDPASALWLDQDTALHPAMGGMAKLWNAGEMQIIEGVGYPDPNRSHFRSIEIWNAGMGANSTQHTGWISTAFRGGRGPDAVVGDGLNLGGDMGPLRGPGRFSALRDSDAVLDTLQNLPTVRHAVRPENPSPLDHVLATYESARITGERISTRLEQSPARNLPFPETELGAQLRTAARLLEAGVDVPVLKVVQGGYDTHDAQPYVHEALLGDLSDAILAFRMALQDIGLWDTVAVVTYSEFGRTARENASYGTDHGTAAPVFVAGGRVSGGFGGQRVALDRLVDDDLVHTTDYRHVYSALLRDLWGIEAQEFGPASMRILT